MIPLEGFADSGLVRAIGLALVHFTWQGFAIGAVLAAVLAVLGERRPEARYAASVLGMIVLLAAPLVTTLLILRGSPALPLAGALVHATDAARRWTEPLLPALTAAWGVGAATLQLRLLAAWAQALILRRVGTSPAPAAWRREFERLRPLLSIASRVRLLESTRVAVPSVVGWLRPVILVPASLATGLAADEIRGLLAHELAHIRRHDYVVNFLQCFFESVLFFHPVTWWVSGRLRVEREFCCDDVALRIGGGALAYARTLSSLEERRDRPALPILSARGGNLMMRISRLLGVRPLGRHRATSMGAMALAGVLALGSLAATGCFQDDHAAAESLSGPTVGDPASTSRNVVRSASGEATFDVRENLLVAAVAIDDAVAAGRLPEKCGSFLRRALENGDLRTCDPSDCDIATNIGADFCAEFLNDDGSVTCILGDSEACSIDEAGNCLFNGENLGKAQNIVVDRLAGAEAAGSEADLFFSSSSD